MDVDGRCERGGERVGDRENDYMLEKQVSSVVHNCIQLYIYYLKQTCIKESNILVEIRT